MYYTYEKLIQHAPLLRIMISFCLGVTFAHYVGQNYLVACGTAFLICLLLTIILLFQRKIVYIQSIMIFISVFTFSGWWYMLHIDRLTTPIEDKKFAYKGIVTTEPVEKRRIILFDLYITEGELKGKKVRVSLLKDTLENRYKNISLGSGIKAQSKFNNISINNKDSTTYERWLINHGYRAKTFLTHYHWDKYQAIYEELPLTKRIALSGKMYRKKIEKTLNTTSLDTTSLSIVAAMTLGNKAYISSKVYDTYSQTGVGHILALSGMHLAIIVMILRSILATNKFRILSATFLIFAIWCFVIIAGSPISAVRAAIMTSMIIISELFDDNCSSINSLSFAGLILLIMRPTTLFDVGFQLSFTSVLFIILFSEKIHLPFSKHRTFFKNVIRGIVSIIIISTIAQLATSPLLLYHFGRVSTYYFISNIIAIPSAYLIILTTILLLLTHSFTSLQDFISEILNYIVNTSYNILSFINKLPYGDIVSVKISLSTMFVLYLIEACLIFLFFKYFYKDKKQE